MKAYTYYLKKKINKERSNAEVFSLEIIVQEYSITDKPRNALILSKYNVSSNLFST